MSNATEEEDERVASCGIELDNMKLEECEHMHDKKLFTQPDETHLGECPLCFLPLPIDQGKSAFKTCCSESICKGCVYANMMANMHDKVKAGSCPFCREPANDDENRKRSMKRVKANDPAAMSHMGTRCYVEEDYDGAFDYFTKAAELGDIEAHHFLGFLYYKGEGVEKNEGKMVYHWEMAAIGGHPQARHKLACYEWKNGNIERAVKHFVIAAKLGEEKSMKALWNAFKDGDITKEDLDATLRAHQAALNAMKSAQRVKAEEIESYSNKIAK